MTVYRRVWTMELQQGAEDRYDEAHAAIWPDLTQQMVADGIRRFHLFRDGRTVFAFQEREKPFPTSRSGASDVTERWWKEMSSLMVTDADGRPLHRVFAEVFSLEESLKKVRVE